MSKHSDATAALHADPGTWAACRAAAGRSWPLIARDLWQATGVGVSWRTVRLWALASVDADDGQDKDGGEG